MKNRIIEAFIMIILMMLIIYIQSPKVYADWADLAGDAQTESGDIPPDPTPPDVPTTPEIPTTPTPTRIPITLYTYIKGNVYEDLGAGYIPGKEKPDDDTIRALGIKDVLVTASNGVNTYTVRTDQYGNYSFGNYNMAPGQYTLTFQYGYIDNTISQSDKTRIKNILKYNGFDYTAVAAPKKPTYDMTQLEVESAGRGAAQVYIALDCSMSMTNSMVNIDGENKTRLQVQVEATQKLIESLLSSGDNIYVGLVVFAGNNYRAVSLTKNQEILKTALEDLLEMTKGKPGTNWRVNTNIVGALQKAQDSFYNKGLNSNRYIILLSDGIPTSDGEHETYNGEAINESIRKLQFEVIPTTKKKVEEVVNNDKITLISLFTDTNNTFEEGIIKDTFSASELYYVQQGEETIKAIKDEIKAKVFSTTTEGEYNGYPWTWYQGNEYETRRKEVEDKFNIFDYQKAMLFDIIDNYDESTDDYNKAKKLSADTYMTVEAGGKYRIDAIPADTSDQIVYKKDPETGEDAVDEDGEKIIDVIYYYVITRTYESKFRAKKKT